MSKTTQDHHNDAQRDVAQGNGYNRPHGHVKELCTWTPSASREIARDNEAYRAGYHNAEKQKK